VTIDGLGAHTGTIATKERRGNGGSGWSPSTFTPITQCPDGAVVTGMAVHGSTFTTYFLDAAITCTRFDAGGSGGMASTVAVTGSLTDANNPSSASCAADEHVVEMTTNTGAGLDSLQLLCAATQCD
jgi:hypothetical protein